MTSLNLRKSADYDEWFDGYTKYLWSDRDNPQFAYVPENVRIGSLIGHTSDGPDRFLILSSAAPQAFSDKITITGFGLDGNVAPLAFENRFADARNPLSDVPGEAGMGVFDSGGRWAGQIDYYEDHPIYGSASERLLIDFGGTVTNLFLTASMVGSREAELYNEAGRWTAYGVYGNVIGSGYVSPEFGKSTNAKHGYGEYVVEVKASMDVAWLTIEAVAFDASLGSGSGYEAAESGVQTSRYDNEQAVNPAVMSNENNSDFGLSALSYDRVGYSGSAPGTSPTHDPARTPPKAIPAGLPVIEGSGRGDFLFGGGKAEGFLGKGGGDVIRSRGGADVVFSGKGGDTVYGGGSKDVVGAGPGADNVYGKGGFDRIFLETGADRAKGGSGNDSIWGDSGRDTIWGESGDDFLLGGRHDDVLYGGGGRDVLVGGHGNDRLYGQGGADTYVFGAGRQGSDRIHGFGVNDTVVFDGLAAGDVAVWEVGDHTRFTWAGGKVLVDETGLLLGGDYLFV